jgi:excisionase family DNA binding protein
MNFTPLSGVPPHVTTPRSRGHPRTADPAIFAGYINDYEDTMNQPLAYSIAEACAVARAGRTAVYEAIKSGELIARKRGRRTIILSDELRRWLDSLPAIAPKTKP